METKLLQTTENPLFSRKEVQLMIKDSITPSKEVAMEVVAKELKSKPELVRIRKIDAKFGSNEFVVIADVYSSQEEFKRVVKKTKQEIKAEEEKRKAEEEARKAAEEAAKVQAEAPEEEAN